MVPVGGEDVSVLRSLFRSDGKLLRVPTTAAVKVQVVLLQLMVS